MSASAPTQPNVAANKNELGKPNEDGNFDCAWSREDFYGTSSAKKAISICMFMMFLGYTVMVILRYKNRNSKVSVTLYSYTDAMAFIL